MAKILVVDDEKEVAEGLASLLLREGFRVTIADNGRACLNLARIERPDLILLDINMPGMDGGDVAHALSENPKVKNIPIIYVSGMVTKGDETKIRGRVFISKISTDEEILKKIKDVLGAVL